MKIIFVFILNSTLCLLANAQGAWTQKADLNGAVRSRAIGFAIDSCGYIGTGMVASCAGCCTNDFWQWNKSTNTWTKKANFPGGGRFDAIAFVIGNKGYVGGGGGMNWQQDFWEYDPSQDSWTQKADLGGGARAEAVGFSIGTKGYIVTGGNGAAMQDFWEWDQSTNVWTQRADFPSVTRAFAAGFSIGNKGYVLGGLHDNPVSDFWEWDQATDTWTRRSDFGGGNRSGLIAFSIGTKGYAGTGCDFYCSQDFWEWDQNTDTWTQLTNFGGTSRAGSVGFAIGNKGYIGTGDHYSPYAGYPYEKDFWEYDPSMITGTKNMIADSDIKIFPNPTSGIINVATAISGSGKICVYDISGQCIINKEFNENNPEINLSGQAKGIYFLKIISIDKSLFRKISVE